MELDNRHNEGRYLRGFCHGKLEAKQTIANFASLSNNRKGCSKTDNVEGRGFLFATSVPGMEVFSVVKRICTNNFDKGVCVTIIVLYCYGMS